MKNSPRGECIQSQGMSNLEQSKKAEALRALHSAKPVLLLANVWDVASARIIEESRFPALATSSAGVAFSQGYPDGEKIPPRRMIAVIARIAAAVGVPLTADVEAGYGSKPEDAARTAGEVIEAGAVGMNLEDATGDAAQPLADLSVQLEKIRAVRQASEKAGVPLVLNARTDVYLLEVGEPSKRYDETLRRLAAFRDAGADCVFVPGLSDPPTIGRLVADLKCPVNILAVPGSPSVGELAMLGVKRISLGSGPMRATLGFLRRLATELQTQGTYTNLGGAPPYAEMNALMTAKRNAGSEH
jgi:2-methylisocitrate lyase-like PEP mutase family enzyme